MSNDGIRIGIGTEATVADYVRFFLHFLRAEEGAFVLIESSEEIGWSKNPYP